MLFILWSVILFSGIITGVAVGRFINLFMGIKLPPEIDKSKEEIELRKLEDYWIWRRIDDIDKYDGENDG